MTRHLTHCIGTGAVYDYVPKHQFYLIGFYDGYLIYRCSNCGWCTRELARFVERFSKIDKEVKKLKKEAER